MTMADDWWALVGMHWNSRNILERQPCKQIKTRKHVYDDTSTQKTKITFYCFTKSVLQINKCAKQQFQEEKVVDICLYNSYEGYMTT